MNAFFKLEGRLPVTPGAIDPPKLLFVRHSRSVRVTFRASQRFVGGIVQFLPAKMDYFFAALFRFPINGSFMARNTGRILGRGQKRPDGGDEG
jgi:hypothetical protein